MLTLDISLIIFLILIGFLVGVLSGFFGFGGGFIITPFLLTLSVPANIAIGTSITLVLGASVIATMRHRNFKNIDYQLGLIISIGTIIGVEIGAQLVEHFKIMGSESLDNLIHLIYIFVLVSISVFMSYEAWTTRKTNKPRSTGRIAKKVQSLRIPPMINLLYSNNSSTCVWVLLFIGFITGILAGFMGAGGGVVQVPMMIYFIGCKTIAAIGTSLFSLFISGIYATFSHAMKGNVDIFLAAIMLIGSSVGTGIGVSATKYVKGANLRLIFGFCVGLVSFSVLLKLTAKLFEIDILTSISQYILILTVGSLALFIIALTFIGAKKKAE